VEAFSALSARFFLSFSKHASFKPLGSSTPLDSHLARASESDVLSEPCGYSLGSSSSITSMIGLRVTIRVPTHQLEYLHEPLQPSHSAFCRSLCRQKVCTCALTPHLSLLSLEMSLCATTGIRNRRIATRDTIQDVLILPTARDCGIVPHPRI
jgi:hypothetical protein